MIKQTIWGAVATAVLAAAPGCPQGAELGAPSYEGGPAAQEIYYFGDSHGALSRGADTQVHTERWQFSTRVPTGVSVWDNTVVGGTFLQDWHPAMAELPAGSVVGLELVTNNLQNETHQVTEQHMLDTLDLLRERGVSRVVWLTINEYSAEQKGYPYLSRVRWANDWMTDLVASGAYADIGLEIYDWNAYAYPQGRAWLSDDNLHNNTAGTNAFGCAMYEAVMGPVCMEDHLP